METLCRLCPRRCSADRQQQMGFCGVPSQPVVARAALHFWEEPCISGERGSGTVFFSGCTLRCVFCQNREISRGQAGRQITVQRLCEIFLRLQSEGAHNINLVTPDHYATPIAEAVRMARSEGLSVPVIANTGGYLSQEIFSLLSPVVDIWLTDFKYWSGELAARLSAAPDYPETAKAALARMVQQTGAPRMDEAGMLQSGVVVRLLLLPGELEDAKRVLRYVYRTYGERVILSLMSQYTPPKELPEEFSQFARTVTPREYDALCSYALSLGIEDCYIQEGDAAQESFIPPFNLEGV